MGSRGDRKRSWYDEEITASYVKWANTPQRQWLPLSNMDNCCRLLREYFEKDNREIPERVKQFLEHNEKLQRDKSSSPSPDDANGQVAVNDPSTGSDDD